MNIADLYVDKGTDFDAIIEINGLNNCPVCVENWRFAASASLLYNSKVKISIECEPYTRQKGCIRLHIPHCQTAKLPEGIWNYTVEMSYKDLPLTFDKKLRVVSGRLIVDNQNTCRW